MVISYRIGQVIAVGQAQRSSQWPKPRTASSKDRNGATIGAHDRNKKKARIAKHLETTIEFLTASPPMGLLLIKPAELLLLYTGADRQNSEYEKLEIYT